MGRPNVVNVPMPDALRERVTETAAALNISAAAFTRMALSEKLLRFEAERWAVETAHAQGLPETVEDPAVLAELAALVVEAKSTEATDGQR